MEIIKIALTFYLWAGILIDILYMILHFKFGEEDELAKTFGMTKALILTTLLWPLFIYGVIYGIIDELIDNIFKH